MQQFLLIYIFRILKIDTINLFSTDLLYILITFLQETNIYSIATIYAFENII